MLLLKRGCFIQEKNLFQAEVHLQLNPLALNMDTGWKAAACSNSSAMRYSFLDVFIWMAGAFGLMFSF